MQTEDQSAMREKSSDPGAEHLTRLMRAESDLQSAISECMSALDEVRRELHRQDVHPSPPAIH